MVESDDFVPIEDLDIRDRAKVIAPEAGGIVFKAIFGTQVFRRPRRQDKVYAPSQTSKLYVGNRYA